MDGHNHSSLFYQITSCDFFANTFEPPPYSGFIICALTALATRIPHVLKPVTINERDQHL